MCFLPASSCFRLSCLPAGFPVGFWAPESGSSWPFSALPAIYHLKGSTVISFVWNSVCLQDALHKKARHGIVKGPCGPAPSPPVLQGLAPPPPPTAAVSKAMTEAIPCAQASPVTELQQPPAPVLLQSYSSYCS